MEGHTLDIVELAIGLFIYVFLLELAFGATELSSKRFWGFCALAMGLLIGAQLFADGSFSYGATTVSLSTMLRVGIFFVVLVPVMRIWAAAKA